MNAIFGIDLYALIGGDFKADDGLGATTALWDAVPCLPGLQRLSRAVFDRRYEGGDPVPGCWRRGRHLRLRLAFTVVRGVGVGTGSDDGGIRSAACADTPPQRGTTR